MTKKAYILRTCSETLTSYGGFQWPASGPVAAPDWDPTPTCGKGLHGFLNGCGDGSLADLSQSAKWLIVEVEEGSLIDLDGKVKFPSGNVTFCGDREGAIARLEELAPETKAMPVIGARRMVGGNHLVCAGHYGTATAGHYGTATAGDGGTATAGHYGTATAGYGGTATAGDWGTANAGEGGTANAGYEGTATAGEEGRIQITWWDSKVQRYRTAVGDIGEDGLLPNTPYRVDNQGKFVRATDLGTGLCLE